MNLSRPHDSFFKKLMENPKNVKDFLIGFLPDNISSLIDYDSLSIIDREKEDIKYKKYYLDLQIRCKIKPGKEATIYIVFEHKSYPDKLTMIQILNYCSVIWEKNIKEKKDLIPILPIVFYHGRRRYNLPTRFIDYFSYLENDILELLKDYLLDFKILLFDTEKYKDEEILKFSDNVELIASLLIMKHIFDDFDKLKEVIKDILNNNEFLREKIKNNKDMRNQFIFIIVEYMVMGKDVNENQMDEFLKEIGGEDMPTLAKKWVEKGREEGILIGMNKGIEKGRWEGIYEGLQEGIKLALEVKFGGEGLMFYNTYVKHIDSIDKLEELKDKIRTAGSVEELEE